VRYANQLPRQVESLIVTLKRDKPHWGARKIRELLVRRLASDVRVPAKSTIHAVLDRHGLVRRMDKRRPRANGTPLSQGALPNDLWCADYKGEFLLGNRRWCYPLTVADHASRFVLTTTYPTVTADHFRDADTHPPVPHATINLGKMGTHVTRVCRILL
jgi:transposase InsO family protein